MLPLAVLRAPLAAEDSDEAAAARHTYFTSGVHNDAGCAPPEKCIYPRQPGEPTDPIYPVWWSSDWIMYRVFRNYDQFPPPTLRPRRA